MEALRWACVDVVCWTSEALDEIGIIMPAIVICVALLLRRPKTTQ
jgi:hypothetical protein